MKYLHEFRDWEKAKSLLARIRQTVSRPWAIMEVCGGQTHSLIRNAIDQVLPAELEMIHGPGCPVCVTPLEVIDRALAIASRPEVTFCTFGDMLRVPGTASDLARIKAAGADVRVVYSPLDALKLATQQPQREVVFFAIGFETTAPANAMTIKLAKEQGVQNFSALVSQVLVPPAMESILSSANNRVQAFLAAGHVCSVTGYRQYHELCARYNVPIIVTGFEPLDLLDGIYRAAKQLQAGTSYVENAYGRVVCESGNLRAQATIDEVFCVADQCWRGMGVIKQSGLVLRDQYAELDAAKKFTAQQAENAQQAGHAQQAGTGENQVCRAGEVLSGVIKPNQCVAFGSRCTPQNPLGAPMVSSEGACAAYFNYGRFGVNDKTN